LQAGVDHYVCKPFSAKELMLRIQVILKRAGVNTVQNFSGLQLDKNGFIMKFNDKEVRLTNLEFTLLNLLMQNSGRIYSREQIIELAYKNESNISDRAIDSHIKNIRKKVRLLDIENNIIEIIYGAGFRYIPNS
jgi:two-component system response regulator BaeR